MSDYVIGVACKTNEASAVAMDMEGRVLSEVHGKTCFYVTVGRNTARQRAGDLVDQLLASFAGDRGACRCLLVSAVGIDSPKTKQMVTEWFAAMHFLSPLICMNDGNMALYTTTKGLGVLAVAGNGSIAVGRNAQGMITRSGGYPLSILGNEGSLQWIGLSAMHLVSQWLDGSIAKTLLIEKIDHYFKGLDIEKLTICAQALRRRPIDPAIGELAILAAQEGDETAAGILRRGARSLFGVAETCIQKLGFTEQDEFLSGMWGDVFRTSRIYADEYARLLAQRYPHSHMVLLAQDDAESAANMALDYLGGKIPYINSLQ